jgi:hypothetical protein
MKYYFSYAVFMVVTLYELVGRYQCFGETQSPLSGPSIILLFQMITIDLSATRYSCVMTCQVVEAVYAFKIPQ